MLKTKKVTEVFQMPVYTNSGDYFGDIEEAILSGNKVQSWRIRATKHSKLGKLLTGAKGAIVPHAHVQAIGDIMLVSDSAIPASEDAADDVEAF
jgi:sporulation protein YlmC with PRC-barrel domain